MLEESRAGGAASLPPRLKRHDGRESVARGGGEALHDVADPPESVVVGFVRIFPVDPGTRHNFEGPLGVVKDEHGVTKDEVGFGKAEWIGMTVGKSFEMPDHVVAEVADSPPVKLGKAGHLRGAALV